MAQSGFEGLLTGHSLAGRYRVDEVIGRGGFAAVYRAVDERLGRTVAVKVITQHAGPDVRDEVQKRFQREARAIASLHHPNVVTVYDFGTDPGLGLDFLVMELLQGEVLSDRLKRIEPITVVEALRILLDAAAGVNAGHHAGLIHRDIKPGNIFLARSEGRPGTRVCVLDFGIARFVEQDTTQLTRSGRAFLSPAYAAPEQLRGDRQITPAADVFSLGVIGYQLLARERPFRRDRLHSEPDSADVPLPLRERNPAVPSGVAEVIHRAIREAPEDRYADAGDFAAALRAAAEQQSPLPGAWEPVPTYVPSDDTSQQHVARAASGDASPDAAPDDAAATGRESPEDAALAGRAALAAAAAGTAAARPDSADGDALDAASRTVDGDSADDRARIDAGGVDGIVPAAASTDDGAPTERAAADRAVDDGSIDRARPIDVASPGEGLPPIAPAVPVDAAAADHHPIAPPAVADDSRGSAALDQPTRRETVVTPPPSARRKTNPALIAVPVIVLLAIVAWVFAARGGHGHDAVASRTASSGAAAAPGGGSQDATGAAGHSPAAGSPRSTDGTRASGGSAATGTAANGTAVDGSPVHGGAQPAGAADGSGSAPGAPAAASATPAASPASTGAGPGANASTPAAAQANTEGEALFARGETDAAVARFRVAVQAAPNNAYYHNNLGWALFQLGQVDAAGQELNTAIRLDPNRDIAYANIGEVERARGNRTGAIAAYQRFLRLNRDPRRARIARDKLRALQGG